MEVWPELLRPEPDEYAAEQVEEHISDKLCSRDTDTHGQGVGDSCVQIHPDRAEANVYHLASDDCLDAIPSD